VFYNVVAVLLQCVALLHILNTVPLLSDNDIAQAPTFVLKCCCSVVAVSLQRVAVCYSVLQCDVVCCSVVAVCCSVLQIDENSRAPAFVRVCMCTYTYIHVYIYTCIYVYIYKYIHVYIHIYKYT